jgi:tetratricopeptide (TPR) repeat protein
MSDDISQVEPQAEENNAADTMLQEAVEAIKQGNKPRAKELLTLLLKTNQKNPVYWLWLSASVDNAKERIYCLQTALKLDPENVTAKRGLILLGAMQPDENIQPFSMNRARTWEEKLLLSHEKPKLKGMQAVRSSPILRLGGIAIIMVLICAGAAYGLMSQPRYVPPNTNTPGPSPTFSPTPTLFGATAQPTSITGPTPLWMFLAATYTPTPSYINTPRGPVSSDYMRGARAALAKGNWDEYITNMQQIATLEPESADVVYYIGEAYRFKGDYDEAIRQYNNALRINPNFGPAYLGMARASLQRDPNEEVLDFYEAALRLDPNYGEIYIDRAMYFIERNSPDRGLEDLTQAQLLLPNSAGVELAFAEAYIKKKDFDLALTHAIKANEMDITLLDAYLILGEVYVERGEYDKAIEKLDTFTTYNQESAKAFALYGQSYYLQDEYQKAITELDRAIQLDKFQWRAFLYRGLTYTELEDYERSVPDLEKAYEQYPDSFELNLALTKSYYVDEKYGSAYLKAESLSTLAQSQEQQALVYYWRALINEKRDLSAEAIKDWQLLLTMPSSAMSAEMRKEAQEHLKVLVTPTTSPTFTITPKAGSKTVTPTVKAGSATATPKPGTLTVTPTAGTTTATPKTGAGGTATKTPTLTGTSSATPMPTK